MKLTVFMTVRISIKLNKYFKTINWRRERDSNPRRAINPYTLSRRAPSATQPSLRIFNAMLESARIVGKSAAVIKHYLSLLLLIPRQNLTYGLRVSLLLYAVHHQHEFRAVVDYR